MLPTPVALCVDRPQLHRRAFVVISWQITELF